MSSLWWRFALRCAALAAMSCVCFLSFALFLNELFKTDVNGSIVISSGGEVVWSLRRVASLAFNGTSTLSELKLIIEFPFVNCGFNDCSKLKCEYATGLFATGVISCPNSFPIGSLLTRVNKSWSDRVRCDVIVDNGWLLRLVGLTGKWKLVTDVEALVKSSSAIWDRNGNVDVTVGLPFVPTTERGEWSKENN